MQKLKTHLSYAAAVAAAVIFTWLIHEFGHWITAKALGYSPVMTLNTVFIQERNYNSDWHQILVSAMGPVITIIQALVIYRLLSKKGWNKFLFPLLLLAFYTRALAGVMNLFNLNDEGRISNFLGIGNFTLSIIISALLFWLVFKVSKASQPGWRYHVFTLLLVMLFSSVWILADNAWHPFLLW